MTFVSSDAFFGHRDIEERRARRPRDESVTLSRARCSDTLTGVIVQSTTAKEAP